MKSRVRACRVTLPPDDFGTRTVRGVGFRFACECGFEGPVVRTYRDARAAMRAHVEQHRTVPPLTLAGPV